MNGYLRPQDAQPERPNPSPDAGARAGEGTGVWVALTSPTGGIREPAAQQRAQHPEAIYGGQLLALVGGARPVVHRYLEDTLAALHEPRGDLGLDREPRRAQPQGAEHVGPDHLVAGHDVVQVHVEQHVARERDAL